MKVYKLLYKLSTEILPIAFWVLLIFGFDKPYIALITLLCAVIHEIGHYTAILLLKCDTGTPIGHFSGFRIKKKNIVSYRKSIIIFLGGPMANFAFGMLFFLPSFFSGYSFWVFAINIGTAFSNLLPIRGYDGYNIMFSIIKNKGLVNAEIWLRRASFLFCTLLSFLSLYLMYYRDGGYWIYGIFTAMMISEMSQALGSQVCTNNEEKRRF